MPGGGDLVLVATNNMNLFFNAPNDVNPYAPSEFHGIPYVDRETGKPVGQPLFTPFYKAYRKYSHFAMENIAVPFSSTSDSPMMDTSLSMRVTLPRSADLVTDVCLSFAAPSIYSPLHATNSNPYEFQWVPGLGYNAIERITVIVNGQTMQSYPGEYLGRRAKQDMSPAQYNKFKRLIGWTTEMTAPASGLFKSASGNGYPNTIDGGTAAGNRPSIPGRRIVLPLGAWFMEDTACSLPLVLLQNCDVEIQVVFKPIRYWYTVLDAGGGTPTTRIRPANATATNIGAFLQDVTQPRSVLDTWHLLPQLEVNYAYLTAAARNYLAAQPLMYMYKEVRQYSFPAITTRTRFLLDEHGLSTRIYFFARRSDAGDRNDWENMSNWTVATSAPITYAGSQIGVASSGVAADGTQREIIRGAIIRCDGTEIVQEHADWYFSRYQPYRFCEGEGDDLEFVHSFALSHRATDPPSGTCNMSRFKRIELELDVHPLATGATYTYDMTFFVERYNLFSIQSGYGGKRFQL
jgi:hypothetical protein